MAVYVVNIDASLIVDAYLILGAHMVFDEYMRQRVSFRNFIRPHSP